MAPDQVKRVTLPCCVCGKPVSYPDPQEWTADPPPLCSDGCRKRRKEILHDIFGDDP